MAAPAIFAISPKCHFYVVNGRILVKFGTLVQNDTLYSRKRGHNHHFLHKQNGGSRHLVFRENGYNFA